MKNEYFAHSGISEKGISPQFYYDHIKNCYEFVNNKINKYKSNNLQKILLFAVLYHDLGKLDSKNQEILSKNDYSYNEKMLNHVDAGVAYCIKKYKETKDFCYFWAGILIHAHHIGLQNLPDYFEIQRNGFNSEIREKIIIRDCNNPEFLYGLTVKDYVDSKLNDLVHIHTALFNEELNIIEKIEISKKSYILSSMELRFCLSLLVDADHTDTANHSGFHSITEIELFPELRIKKLDKYIEKIKNDARDKNIDESVINSRNVLISLTKNFDKHNNFYLCAAPTGKGKTLALQNMALNLAITKKAKKIFFIVPFTNIISQSVKHYRNAVTLKNENPLLVVNEIHSKVEFKSFYHRQYTHQWNAPINVATAVQFFESIISNEPTTLRKLHHFIDSIIIFDEYHTAIPHEYWEFMLCLFKKISELFNITFIFGSGTHILYWKNLENFEVTDIVPEKIHKEFQSYENKRIKFDNLGVLANDQILKNHILSQVTKNNINKSILIVFNTIKSAKTFAKMIKNYFSENVYLLTSNLTPSDREIILDKIHEKLKNNIKIILIATSIIECGVDFSFEIGYRQHTSLSSLFQFAGRINRNCESDTPSIIYEFGFDPNFIDNNKSLYTDNPQLTIPILVSTGLERNVDNCTVSIENELIQKIGVKSKIKYIETLENDRRFQDIKNHIKVIDGSSSRTVVIKKDIIEKIKNEDKVGYHEIIRNSVTIRSESKYMINFKPFNDDDPFIGYWTGNYDPDFEGIML